MKSLITLPFVYLLLLTSACAALELLQREQGPTMTSLETFSGASGGTTTSLSTNHGRFLDDQETEAPSDGDSEEGTFDASGEDDGVTSVIGDDGGLGEDDNTGDDGGLGEDDNTGDDGGVGEDDNTGDDGGVGEDDNTGGDDNVQDDDQTEVADNAVKSMTDPTGTDGEERRNMKPLTIVFVLAASAVLFFMVRRRRNGNRARRAEVIAQKYNDRSLELPSVA